MGNYKLVNNFNQGNIIKIRALITLIHRTNNLLKKRHLIYTKIEPKSITRKVPEIIHKKDKLNQKINLFHLVRFMNN